MLPCAIWVPPPRHSLKREAITMASTVTAIQALCKRVSTYCVPQGAWYSEVGQWHGSRNRCRPHARAYTRTHAYAHARWHAPRRLQARGRTRRRTGVRTHPPTAAPTRRHARTGAWGSGRSRRSEVPPRTTEPILTRYFVASHHSWMASIRAAQPRRAVVTAAA